MGLKISKRFYLYSVCSFKRLLHERRYLFDLENRHDFTWKRFLHCWFLMQDNQSVIGVLPLLVVQCWGLWFFYWLPDQTYLAVTWSSCSSLTFRSPVNRLPNFITISSCYTHWTHRDFMSFVRNMSCGSVDWGHGDSLLIRCITYIIPWRSRKHLIHHIQVS